MYDREAFDVVATDIAQWQTDALHPAAARTISHDGHLAEKPDREPERLQRQLRLPPRTATTRHDEFRYAIGEVARRATAMAIFALAAAQRLHMAAQHN